MNDVCRVSEEVEYITLQRRVVYCFGLRVTRTVARSDICKQQRSGETDVRDGQGKAENMTIHINNLHPGAVRNDFLKY